MSAESDEKPRAPATGPQVRRFNLNIPERMFQDLEALSRQSGSSMSEIVKTALGLYAVASDETAKDHQVLIADRDGKPLKQLILPKR